jgi:hypothetical protein
MLPVGNLGLEQSAAIFKDATSINMLPVVSAEWNYNLIKTPYITMSGECALQTLGTPTGATLSTETGSYKKENFTTKKFSLSSGSAKVVYPVTLDEEKYYKVVLYAKTNSKDLIMLNCFVDSSSNNTLRGSSNKDIDSFGWTKIETYIGCGESLSSIDYIISANAYSNSLDLSADIYFTVPEIYSVTQFEFENSSLWPTDSVYNFFRPGESYVSSGNDNIEFPTNYRRVSSQILKSETQSGGYYGNKYMPLNSIVNNPSFALAKVPVPFWKHVLPTDITPYKFFVSDEPLVDGIAFTMKYDEYLNTNKLVFKFNTLLSIPKIKIYINGNLITVDTITEITVNSLGLLTLYWNGSAWTQNKWSEMPTISDSGELTKTTTVNEIKVLKIDQTMQSGFTSEYQSNQDLLTDAARLQIIEISPRLELDLTDFVTNISINKSLDSNNTYIPVSSINSNDASISFSNIPATLPNTLIPIFSNESNLNETVLKNMLKQNVKFYIYYNLKGYSGTSSSNHNYSSVDYYIPGGIFYSDSWQESSNSSVTVQAFDISKYLQTLPVPDYAANLKTVFDVITNILDMAGFTDYDYDSLYSICNDITNPMDLSYYYCNSKDTTVLGALSELFISHQIGAYIDEYGIMKFLNIKDMLSKNSSLQISDNHVVEDGYSLSSKTKPGKISIRYQPPKIKQSASIHNADENIKNSSSFIYTTSNDVLWSQQNIDSVGFNYLQQDMSKDDTSFVTNQPSSKDYFHTYDLNANNYAIIEDEVVSFAYKKYTISNDTDSVDVFVKNSIELQSEINKFVKKYASGLKVSVLSSSGLPLASTDFDVTVTPTGEIGNVARGLFNTKITDHILLTDFEQEGKSLSQATVDVDQDGGNYYSITQDTTLSSVSNNKIETTTPTLKKSLIYPTTERNELYQTYSTKFELKDLNSQSAGLFFNLSDTFDSENSYYLELTKYTPVKIEDGLVDETKTSQTRFILSLYQIVYNQDGSSLIENTVAWSDVTSIANYLLKNTTQVFVEDGTSYKSIKDKNINLRMSYFYNYKLDPDDPLSYYAYPGEDEGVLISVFLNNIEISGWQIPIEGAASNIEITDAEKYLGSITYTASNSFQVGDSVVITGISPSGYNIQGNVTQATGSAFTVRPPFSGGALDAWVDLELDPYVSGGTATELENSGQNDFTGWKPLETNIFTGIRKKVSLPSFIDASTIFGAFTSTESIAKYHRYTDYITKCGDPGSGCDENGYYVPDAVAGKPSIIKEIYACEVPLLDRSASYYTQSKEFLNKLVQGQRQNVRTYIMQAVPEIIGLNYYDVQYQTPAAVTSNVYPIQYSMLYYPGNKPSDQKWWQKLNVPETALAYSAILNTGFRAKMAIANNSPFLVYLNKDADEVQKYNIKLNLWTHEVIAQSDQEIIEKVITDGNSSETAQIDSEWIQSKESALNLMSLIGKSIDGFSKDTSITIFGNPLIQVGDAVELTYPIAGINQRKYLVHAVSQSFDNGLNTTLSLKTISDGVKNSIADTISTIVISPSITQINTGQTQQFSAIAYDQYGDALVTQPIITWSTSSGSISSTGLYQAGLSKAKVEVRATSGSISGSTEFNINISL